MSKDARPADASSIEVANTATTPTATTPVELPDDPGLLKQINRELLELVSKLQRQNDSLQHQLEQFRRRLYGQKSERFDPNQPLLFPELAQSDGSNGAVDTPASQPTAEDAAPEKKRKSHGRNGLNPKLRRERHVYELPEAERQCPQCHATCQKFGEDVSEQLDYVPASLFVHQHVRCKYACPHCHDRVVVADKPEQPIAKGLPGAGLLAQVVVSKYADHLPLHRLERIFARHGVELARSTMCDWMKRCADLLRPLYDRMVSLVLLSKSVHTDDTKVPHQDPDNPGKTTSARLWVYLGDDEHPFNVFDFTLTWSRDGPRKFLTERLELPDGTISKFQGILQADALSGYDGVCAELGIVRGGCWAHARRHFWDARDSDPARAAEAMARIRRLYAVEDEIRETIETALVAKKQSQGMITDGSRPEAAGDDTRPDVAPLDDVRLDAAEVEAIRLRLRQEKAVPELTSLCHWLKEQQPPVLPKSPIGQAIAYALNHWESLLLYTQHGFLAIDNNAAERALRAIAVGRNNWLFVGSQTGGHTAAILFTMTSTCRRLNVEPFAYLRDVLSHLAADPLPAADLDRLLPDRWTPPPPPPADQPQS